MRFFCAIMTLLCVVLAGCSVLDDLTKDDVSDVADCYEQTIIVDDHYAIVLDKDCMDLALLSAGPKIALEAEAIEKAEEAPEPEAEDVDPPVIDSTPVVIPTDVDWELIATLQRNPLDPEMFYIFPEQKEAISKPYEEGKHFIFEIGGEFREGNSNVIRHYIIQPEAPFQDQHKLPRVVIVEEADGTKWHVHNYTFLSEGWYATHQDLIGNEGIGLGVQFEIQHIDWPAEGLFPAVKKINYNSSIGVMDSSGSLGRSNSAIGRDARLRIYVSRD